MEDHRAHNQMANHQAHDLIRFYTSDITEGRINAYNQANGNKCINDCSVGGYIDFPFGTGQWLKHGREQQMIDQTQLSWWNINSCERGYGSNTGKSFVIIAERNGIMPGVGQFTGHIATLRRVA